MSDIAPNLLHQKVASAISVVEHLIFICQGHETDVWLAKFVAVREALTAGDLGKAIREESRLSTTHTPQWVASREMSKKLEQAMGLVCRQFNYPNQTEAPLQFTELPDSVAELGTLKDEDDALLRAFQAAFKHDPLEEDPAFSDTLRLATEQAERELADHPMREGLGFCHVFWKRKKQILKQSYNLDWRTPADLNPRITFD